MSVSRWIVREEHVWNTGELLRDFVREQYKEKKARLERERAANRQERIGRATALGAKVLVVLSGMVLSGLVLTILSRRYM